MPMRQFSIAVALVVLAGAAAARADEESGRGRSEREPEVLVRPEARHGGWGAPVVTFSEVRDRDAVFVGGRGGWILDGRLTIGGGGFGLVNEIAAPQALQPALGGTNDLEVGYGGLWLEYTILPLRLVHLTLGTLIGGGGISLVRRDGGDEGLDDGFFVVEPVAALELNVARPVRADLAVTYRWVAGVDLGGAVGEDDLRAFGVSFLLKLGSF